MIKKNKPYQPFPEENILTKAPKTSDTEIIIQADPNAKPLFLNTETGTYTDIDGNPVTVKPRLGCNSNPTCPFDKKECSPNFKGFAEMDGYLDCHNCERRGTPVSGKIDPEVAKAALSNKLPEILAGAPEKPSLSSVVAVLSVLAMGLIAAGVILLALYNCVAHT